jgi:hypothetical protein
VLEERFVYCGRAALVVVDIEPSMIPDPSCDEKWSSKRDTHTRDHESSRIEKRTDE